MHLMYNSIGDSMKYKLRSLREDNDMTQEEVAKFLNMTRTNYSRIEQEQVTLSFDTALMLAKLFNVSLEDLLANNYDHKTITNEDIVMIKKAADILAVLEKRFSKK